MGAWLESLHAGTIFMAGSLLLGGLLILYILFRVQRETNQLDFSDWLRGTDGKASWSKAAAIGGFMVGSWCLITITLAGKVPDGYWLLFLTYFAIVIGNPAAIELVKQRDPRSPQPVPTTATVTADPGSQVNVQFGQPPAGGGT
jgi:hypothetical protein